MRLARRNQVSKCDTSIKLAATADLAAQPDIAHTQCNHVTSSLGGEPRCSSGAMYDVASNNAHAPGAVASAPTPRPSHTPRHRPCHAVVKMNAHRHHHQHPQSVHGITRHAHAMLPQTRDNPHTPPCKRNCCCHHAAAVASAAPATAQSQQAGRPCRSTVRLSVDSRERVNDRAHGTALGLV